MGAVITALTVASALAKKSLATNMRKVLPFVNKVSGIFLALSGVYVLLYGYFEYKILIANELDFENPLINVVSGAQEDLTQWIQETGTTRLGIGLLIIVSAAVLKALWNELSEGNRIGAASALGAAWVSSEFLFTGDHPPALFGQPEPPPSAWYEIFDWERADLLILPFIRTILDIPERFVNWWKTVFEFIPYLVVRIGDLFQWIFSLLPGDYEYVATTRDNPWRWAVIGEMIVLGVVVLAARTYYRRFSAREVEATATLEVADEVLANN